MEECELINNFLQHSTAFEHLSPRPRCYLCVFEVRGVKDGLGLGCGAREAWEGIPRALQPNTNLLSPQRHVNSDRERVSLSLSPGLSATKRRYWTPGSFPATCCWPWCPRKMGRELGTTHYRKACNIHMKNTPAYNEHLFFRLPRTVAQKPIW